MIGVGLSATSQPQTKSFGGPGLVGYSLSSAFLHYNKNIQILGLEFVLNEICEFFRTQTESVYFKRTHSNKPADGFFFTAEDCFVELVFGLNMVVL